MPGNENSGRHPKDYDDGLSPGTSFGLFIFEGFTSWKDVQRIKNADWWPKRPYDKYFDKKTGKTGTRRGAIYKFRCIASDHVIFVHTRKFKEQFLNLNECPICARDAESDEKNNEIQALRETLEDIKVKLKKTQDGLLLEQASKESMGNDANKYFKDCERLGRELNKVQTELVKSQSENGQLKNRISQLEAEITKFRNQFLEQSDILPELQTALNEESNAIIEDDSNNT